MPANHCAHMAAYWLKMYDAQFNPYKGYPPALFCQQRYDYYLARSK